MPFNLGVPELLILFVIITLVFGVGRLPEVGGALGKGIRDFRKGMLEPDNEGKGKQTPEDSKMLEQENISTSRSQSYKPDQPGNAKSPEPDNGSREKPQLDKKSPRSWR